MNEILLFIAVSFILALFAIRFSHRYGIPSLLLFFLLGIGAGYLIDFQNFDFMERYSSFALFIIMFYGGYGTKLAMGLPVLKPAVLLSSLGVVITALVTGLFAHYALGFSMVESMLFGSVIGSTDYASVSSVLQSKNLNLKNHSAPLLELESGSNDPTAYTMTMIFLSILLGWSMSIPLLVVQQIGLALLFGYVMTRIFFIIIERVNFQKEGLFTIFVFTMALGTYALTGVLNGNGYLAVYLFGILIGNREYMGKREVVFFFDGLTEIMQISLFFLIGFLSDITKLIQWLPLGVVVTVFMLFVARPITIFGVMPFFKSTFKQNIVLCWSGLRGAAAIYYQDRSAIGFLETKVLDKELIGLPVKDLNLTFDFIVAKLVRDGKTIVPHGETILEEGDMVVIGGKSHFDEVGRNLQEFTIREHHPWANKRIMDLDLKPSELILMVERDNHILVPSGETMVYVGDKIVYTEDREDLFNHRSAKKKALFNR